MTCILPMNMILLPFLSVPSHIGTPAGTLASGMPAVFEVVCSVVLGSAVVVVCSVVTGSAVVVVCSLCED